MMNNTEDNNFKPRVVPMRLQKFLARSGTASRRASENLMTAGRVKVNGQVVTELGSKVDPLKDVVTVDDILVELEMKPFYIMLYKPDGYVTTMSDPEGRPCVRELVPIEKHPALYPVGRLDMDTTGLLLFTTDGTIGHKCLHPSRHVSKKYLALVKGKVTRKQLDMLEQGVQLEDGPTLPCRCRLMSFNDPACDVVKNVECYEKRNSIVEITIHEGRKRQVKRMLDFIGHPVIRLHRFVFGPLTLQDVKEGTWRYLTTEETEALLQLD